MGQVGHGIVRSGPTLQDKWGSLLISRVNLYFILLPDSGPSSNEACLIRVSGYADWQWRPYLVRPDPLLGIHKGFDTDLNIEMKEYNEDNNEDNTLTSTPIINLIIYLYRLKIGL